MKTNFVKVFELRLISLALISAGCIGFSQAAMLGEIQVRSALGERFNASITVAAAEDEDLNANCFRIVSPQDENAAGILRRARLTYQYEVGGGRLLVKGEEAQSEPVLTLGIRVKCPGEEERVFQRDYRILLDPPEYRPNIAAPSVPSARSSDSSSRSRRKLPAMGTAWLTEDGDSVAKIAASYYPGDKAKQQALVEAIYDINPDLPQNTNARLDGDWRILLPVPTPKAGRSSLAAAPRLENLPAAPQSLEALPRLTLGSDSLSGNAQAQSNLPATTENASGEFRLRLSEANLDTDRKNTLTPEQTLQLRERLLSLESDDQAAQMLQLKYQITELEKKLASFQSQTGQLAERQENTDKANSWWYFSPLIALLLLPFGFWLWRRRMQHITARDDFYTSISPSTSYLHSPSPSGGETSLRSRGLTLGGLNGEEIGTPIHRDHADDWRNIDADDMDVVSPSNVAEEAQLLLDHGLVPQAINLLNHEIAQMPAALALWMKLFEIFQRNAMPEAFQEKAVAFRLQFASDALWKNVQELGLTVDPANPLYQSLELSAESTAVDEPTVDEPKFVGNADDLAFATALHVDAGLDVPDQLIEAREEVAIHNSLSLQDNAPEILAIKNDNGLIYHSSADQRVDHELVENEAIELQALDANVSPFSIQIDDIQVFDPVEIKPIEAHQTASKEAKSAPLFKSDDPALQEIAQLIEHGQRKEAFKLLEEMLYKGTMPQRLTASKWLDKMLGTFGHG
ncbi:hypothetical protein NT239_13275 [Chitinibacter sp. SCUT-21]|uniref:type IV pilus assembly protein FimV n=1 Tax=Chitinibacter sp. SCUT-21 TaxID=2970891 RepID=UPI0035A6DA0C